MIVSKLMLRSLVYSVFSIVTLLTTLVIGVRVVTGAMHPIDHQPAFFTHPDCPGACWQTLRLGSLQDDVARVLSDPDLPLSERQNTDMASISGMLTVVHSPAPGYDETVSIHVQDGLVYSITLSRTQICVRDLLMVHGRPRALVLAPTGEISTVLYNTGIMRASVLPGKQQNTLGIYTMPINYRRQAIRPVRFHWHRLPEQNLRQRCH